MNAAFDEILRADAQTQFGICHINRRLAEAERRMDAIDRGEMASIPWEEAKRQLGL